MRIAPLSSKLVLALGLIAVLGLSACASDPRLTNGRAPLPSSSQHVPPPSAPPAADQTPDRQGWRIESLQGGPPSPTLIAPENAPRRPVNVTMDRAPIPAAAQAVLGDTLKRSYRVDPQVTGEVSIKLSGLMTDGEILTTFDQALRASGAALSEAPGGGLAVVPVKDAPVMSLFQSAPGGGTQNPDAYVAGGVGVYHAHNVGAEEIARLLQPMAGGRAQVRADTTEERVYITGDPATIASLTRAAGLLDVDWLRGRSFQFYPLKYAAARGVAEDVRKVFGGADGPIGSQVELIDIDRLNAIIIAAKSPALLDQTARWIDRLDQPASPSEQRLRVVRLSNLVATDFVKTLSDVFARGQPAGGSISGPNRPTSMASVTADAKSNSIIMFADDAEYQSLLSIVRQLDVAPPQVLIEATVAEVRLNNELRFGVQWFLQNNRRFTGGFATDSKGLGLPNYPGLALTYLAPNVNVVLDALSQVTDVEVLSTPRIMVLANDTATLQVGNSVPIITQSSSGTQDTSLIINSVIYRDTGVVLTVTPRVGEHDELTIDIQQEVSDVSPTTTSTIDSPTIQQRKFHTRIAVDNGQSVAIGGMIQTTRSKGDNGIPYLSRLPGVGAAFRQRLDNNARTELVVFLKPTLVRNRSEADAVTDELAAGLRALGYGHGAH